MNKRWLEALLADAGRLEIRHLPSGKSIVVDSLETAQVAAGRLSGHGNAYTTLNRPHADIAAGSTKALRDADIETIVFLPFDFDPVRPADTSSTEAELAAAVATRDAFVRQMFSRGWPAPATAISGNGAHAVYRVFLRNDDATREMLRTLYTGLAKRFSDDEVHFDVTVRNPARIWRLYGTVNRKGTPTAERPHRTATVMIPADWRRVPTKEIERLANSFAKRREDRPPPSYAPHAPIAGRGDFSTLRIVEWFAAHGLYLGHVHDHIHDVRCPWEDHHSTSTPRDTVIFEADGGWPGFFCHHEHCAGRTIRDVMMLWGDADAFCGAAWRAA